MEGARLFSSLFHDLPDGVCVSEKGGRILYLNPSAERLMGISAAQARDGSLCELLCARLSGPGSEKIACPFREKAEQKSATLEGRHQSPQSFQWRDFEVRSLQDWRDLRVHCLKITTTLFDPKDAEKHLTLIEDLSEAREAEREKEDWHTMVAHDLRAPLTVLMGALYSLRDVPPGQGLEKSDRRMIETAVRAAEQMLSLIQNHLDVARLRSGKVPVRLEKLDAAKILRQCAEEQAPSAASKRIAVVLTLPPVLEVRADAELFQRVLQNLLNNAVKFTSDSGRIEIGAEKIREFVQISFKDTGRGIPPQDLPHIFDRFYRSRVAGPEKIKGVGLGLAFCQEALRAMNGAIQAHSQYGQGSKFVIQIPAG